MKVQVYQFRVRDSLTGSQVIMTRWSCLDHIKNANDKPLDERAVEEDLLDANGQALLDPGGRDGHSTD